MGKADGGQILVTDTVRNLVAGKDYRFSDYGSHVGRPVHAWPVERREILRAAVSPHAQGSGRWATLLVITSSNTAAIWSPEKDASADPLGFGRSALWITCFALPSDLSEPGQHGCQME